MNRRSLLVTLSLGLVAAAAPVWSQASPLEAAFNELPMEQRRNAQIELQLAGLYGGTVDGAYGPGTEGALIAAAKVIAAAGNRGTPDLSTLEGARDYLGRLSMGEFMNPLYDSGTEG